VVSPNDVTVWNDADRIVDHLTEEARPMAVLYLPEDGDHLEPLCVYADRLQPVGHLTAGGEWNTDPPTIWGTT
jgi:hypothetical protein